MSSSFLVKIPPGYCFLPTCLPPHFSTATTTSTVPQPTTSSSHARSTTTSTTTIYGPTFTATGPLPTNSKRSVAPIPELGAHSFQAFPTDAPIQVGNGPICIVFCEWALVQPDLMPALRPISDGTSTTTMMSVRKSTMTAGESSLPTTFPDPHHHQNHHPQPTPGQFLGFVVGGIIGLALLLGMAWLITRQIRRVKSKLNKHTQGVHRDLEREIYERDGGKGVPEIGERA